MEENGRIISLYNRADYIYANSANYMCKSTHDEVDNNEKKGREESYSK